MPDWDADDSTAAERRRILSCALSVDEFKPLSAVVQVEFGTHSRAAPGRPANEDHLLIVRLGRHQQVVATTLSASDAPPLFEEHGFAMVVADGGGILGSGGFASRVAISTLAHLAIHFGRWNLRVDARSAEAIMERAEWFYARAAEAVQRQRRANPLLDGMWSTLTAAFSAGDELFYAHVGHSRAYLFRDGELTQLTGDQTLDERRRQSVGPVPVVPAASDLRHVLTDAIGAGGGSPKVQVERLGLLDGDAILLCTDGLTNVLEDDTIADFLAQPRSLDDQCRGLIDLAFARGANDDATAVIARYRIPSPLRPSPGSGF
jgi:PPM family protein phosphatase